MLSAGYGGVPSTFSTRAGGNEAEITAIKNVLEYNLASVPVRNGSGLSVLQRLNNIDASGGGSDSALLVIQQRLNVVEAVDPSSIINTLKPVKARLKTAEKQKKIP
jgi:hypothetical protein